MTTAESSKQAKKRSKRQRLATIAAATRHRNAGVRILNEGSNSSIMSPPDNKATLESLCPNAKKPKKTRGSTRLIVVSSSVAQLELEFNERGQVIGPNSAKFASQLGCLVREHAPVVVKDWRLVDSSIKEDLWTLTKQLFILDECRKKMSLQIMGKCWRQFKAEMTREIQNAAKSDDMARRISLIRPKNIKSKQEWDAFVNERLSPHFKEKSDTFKSIRRKHRLMHTMSRKGYARLEDEIEKENPTPTAVSRVDVWTRGHTRKNGKPLNAKVGETIVKLQEEAQLPMTKNNIREDALAKVFGPERPGRVRGLGFWATPSRVDVQIQSSARVRKLENQMQSVQSQLDGMRNMQTQFEEMKAMFLQLQQTQNKSFEEMIHHPVDAPPQQGNGTIPSDGNLKYRRCQLLSWYSYETEEVVAVGKIASTDPSSRVHTVPLGLDCWKVWVDQVINPTIYLYRPTPKMSTLDQALGSKTAWPFKWIRLLQ